MGSFDQTFPHIARWVKEYGWIEVGCDGMSPSWVRALDEGDLIWEGGDPTQPLDGTLQELDAALAEWLHKIERRGALDPDPTQR